jgi:16S rRNA (uracil1498-N3)-methyltransferase
LQLFYDPNLQAGPHQLREVEARHAFQVLRKRVGDHLDLVDGKGGWFRAEVTDISKRGCMVEVEDVRREACRADHRLTLLVAPTKNIDRYEWILEKATEIGVDRIQPILTDHSERKRVRIDRLERILESAMKQSLRAWMPELGELISFEEALEQTDTNDRRLMAYLGADETPLLGNNYTVGQNVSLAIGPEGGFSPAEAELAKSMDFEFVSLGPNRLRTETAAIAAVHTIEQINW